MLFVNVYTVVLLLILVLVFIWYNNKPKECVSPSPIRIRRWRDSIKESPGARQVKDDWWDRANNSGQGFQLG